MSNTIPIQIKVKRSSNIFNIFDSTIKSTREEFLYHKFNFCWKRRVSRDGNKDGPDTCKHCKTAPRGRRKSSLGSRSEWTFLVSYYSQLLPDVFLCCCLTILYFYTLGYLPLECIVAKIESNVEYFILTQNENALFQTRKLISTYYFTTEVFH